MIEVLIKNDEDSWKFFSNETRRLNIKLPERTSKILFKYKITEDNLNKIDKSIGIFVTTKIPNTNTVDGVKMLISQNPIEWNRK